MTKRVLCDGKVGFRLRLAEKHGNRWAFFLPLTMSKNLDKASLENGNGAARPVNPIGKV